MTLSPREQIASATMIATHEVVTNLTKAKAAMENLVHEMHDLTGLLTGEGRIIWGNTTTARWLNIDHDSLHEKDLRSLFTGEEWQGFADRLRRVAAGDLDFDEFHLAISMRGSIREVLWSLRPFRSVSDRRGTLVLVVGRDITDVLQARTARAKLEAELETAQIMQQAFFPPSYIKSPTLEIASYYQPAEQCSGDWWGYFDLGQDTELVCIADVTGHGAASALVTAMTQALCMSFADRNQNSSHPVSPAALLKEINEIVFRTFRGDFYMTFFAFVFEHSKRKIRASNAAHNFPMILRNAREPVKNPEAIVVQGNPIGHALETAFQDQELPLNSGDRIVLYTDGITECRNPEGKMYGAGTFRRSIVRHGKDATLAFCDNLMKDAALFFDGQALADDLTLVVIDILA